jgi:cytochrome P450 PksS
MGLLSWLTGRGRRRAAGDPDIASPAHKADPYPFYARLREHSPVHRVTLAGGRPAWLVTRYDDVAAVLRDGRFAKDKRTAQTPDQALADGLLDGLRGRARFDLIRDYALPIPTTVIAEMLGVPVADRNRFHRWSKAMVSADPAGAGMLLVIPHVWAFLRLVRRLIRAKRARPADDLLSALIQAEEAGDRLSEDELVAMAFLLLIAGHETTVNLIGNGTLALLEHPDQLARLRAEPALIKAAVEELLRYASPLETATERYAREDVTVAGVTIRRGEQVFAALGSANRDGRQFPDPDILDLSREPNRHLAFGLGPHFCLGAPLARLEGQVAIGTLVRRIGDVRLAVRPASLRWRRGLVLRGLESLPVVAGKWC